MIKVQSIRLRETSQSYIDISFSFPRSPSYPPSSLRVFLDALRTRKIVETFGDEREKRLRTAYVIYVQNVLGETNIDRTDCKRSAGSLLSAAYSRVCM